MEEDIEVLKYLVDRWKNNEALKRDAQAIENLLKSYTDLVKVSTETAFDTVNKDTEFLCRLLLKQGQIEFNKDKFEYINPRQNKEFEVNGIMYTKEKIFFINDEKLDDYTKQLEYQIKEKERENTRLKYQDIPYLEGTIKGYKDRVEELKQEITVLQNTKDTCPNYPTSGIKCELKEENKRLDYINAHEYRTASKERDDYWKSKVKEKIEELDNLKLCSDKFYQLIIEDKIKLLQGLLEEE